MSKHEQIGLPFKRSLAETSPLEELVQRHKAGEKLSQEEQEIVDRITRQEPEGGQYREYERK
jgi:hypothetical protein